jgi:hypothetical protein
MIDRDALDRWITGGRYGSSAIIVECPRCHNHTPVLMETEYGSSTWTPEDCKHCQYPFNGDEPWEEDEPPEIDYDESSWWDDNRTEHDPTL